MEPGDYAALRFSFRYQIVEIVPDSDRAGALAIRYMGSCIDRSFAAERVMDLAERNRTDAWLIERGNGSEQLLAGYRAPARMTASQQETSP
jgi:hypothetical protein